MRRKGYTPFANMTREAEISIVTPLDSPLMGTKLFVCPTERDGDGTGFLVKFDGVGGSGV